MPRKKPDSYVLLERARFRIGRSVRLATELAESIEAIQREMGRSFTSTRDLPPQQQVARIAQLLRYSPDTTEQLRLLARNFADARAKLDPRVRDEWLRKLLDEDASGR